MLRMHNRWISRCVREHMRPAHPRAVAAAPAGSVRQRTDAGAARDDHALGHPESPYIPPR